MSSPPLRILFIGNSQTYFYDLPEKWRIRPAKMIWEAIRENLEQRK